MCCRPPLCVCVCVCVCERERERERERECVCVLKLIPIHVNTRDQILECVPLSSWCSGLDVTVF